MVAPLRLPSRARERIIFVCKVAFAVLLLGFLIRSGSLDFRSLDIFVRRPLLLVASLSMSALGILIGTLRWSALLRLAGVRLPFGRALQLQMTSLFFNTAIPGNVGGDLLKSAYAARAAEPAKRPTVFLVVFVERLLGLGALVIVAGIVIVLRGPLLWNDPQLHDLAMAVAALAGVTVAAPFLVVVLVRTSGERLERWTIGPSRVARLAAQVVAAARLVSAGPKNLAIALGLSMAAHALTMLLFTALAVAITGHDIAYSAIASVFPLGILTIVVPISPGGIGVGHVAFDHLFSLIGVSGGASVFNAYLIGQIAPSLLGVFPYLALRRSDVRPEAAPP